MTDKTERDALVALAESRHVRVLRELRDTGDVSDWRAMETALTAAIEALAAPAVGGQGESEPMTLAEVLQWIDACNHEPAREVLRAYLRLRKSTPPAASVDVDAVRLALRTARDTEDGVQKIMALIDSAGGAKDGDVYGMMPAPIGNPEAWPPNYADGFNDACQYMLDAMPAEVRARFKGRTPQPAEGDGAMTYRASVIAALESGEADSETLAHAAVWLKERPAATAQAPEDIRAMLTWAVERWHAEVAGRPLINRHRRSLDDVWRQVIRKLGADDVVLIGPRHDDLVALASPEQR